MRQYNFYSRLDSKQEPIAKVIAMNRLSAAKAFAARKQLSLKHFLQIYGINK